MKTVLVFFLIGFSISGSCQDSLQQARLKTLQGKIRSFSSIAKKDSLFLICFFSVNSEESISELNSINTNLESWQNMKHFRFLAVSVDEGNAANKLRPVYNMNEWKFEAYDDLYGDLRKSLHSNNFPQSLILYKNEIVYEQSGWTTGTENYLIQQILSIKH
jgi:cytochrome c biogenesis protein CcmG, thiol:disulfide interchange protein DsbE